MEKTPKYDIHSLDGALAAAESGEIKQWLEDFLQLGATPNEGLVLGLGAEERRQYHGPVMFPLEKLTRTCGPEPHMKFKIDPDSWEKKMSMLVAAIRAGWKPQPLLTPGAGEDALLLHDGNNRHEALRRVGRTDYWTIFHFANEQDKEHFLRNGEYLG